MAELQNDLIAAYVLYIFQLWVGHAFKKFLQKNQGIKPADNKPFHNSTVVTKGLRNIILKRLNTDSEQA